VANFKILFRTLPRRDEENHEQPLSRYPLSGSRIEPSSSRPRNKIAYHSVAATHISEGSLLQPIFEDAPCRGEKELFVCFVSV
jgi:hypothetical protein